MDALNSAVPVEPGSADGFSRPTAIVLQGDCRALMAAMDADSVDSIVCDPPYGLSREPDAVEVLTHWLAGDDYVHTGNGFMGNSWDSFVPGPAVWKEAYRVLKPGGFLLAFFGTRTYDLGAIAIRLAGFEVRDMVDWIYGSGFPKGGNRDGKGTCLKPAHEPIVMARKPFKGSVAANEARYGTGAINIDACRIHGDDAQGGTYTVKRLKPGATLEKTGGNWRPEEGGVEYHGEMKPGRWPANVIHDGSGDVIEGFPITVSGVMKAGTRRAAQDRPGSVCYGTFGGDAASADTYGDRGSAARFFKACPMGEDDWHHLESLAQLARYADNPFASCAIPTVDAAVATRLSDFRNAASPASPGYTGSCNACFQTPNPASDVAALVSTVITPTIAGRLKSSGFVKPAIALSINWASVEKAAGDSDQGSATHFLYCSKASKADRDEGLDQFDPQAFVQFQTGNGESGNASSLSEGRETQYRNIHPTVKPTALMRYLVRLVTPVGGTVLDPFTGSGSTGKASILEGRSFIGCELTEAYVPIARARIAAAFVQADAERVAANPPPPPQIDMFAEVAA